MGSVVLVRTRSVYGYVRDDIRDRSSGLCRCERPWPTPLGDCRRCHGLVILVCAECALEILDPGRYVNGLVPGRYVLDDQLWPYHPDCLLPRRTR